MNIERRIGIVLGTAVIALAITAPWFAADPATTDFTAILSAPSMRNWLGTDQFGRDVLARIAGGGRISLLVAALATIIAGMIGTLLGVIAGAGKGVPAKLLSHFIDLCLALPRVVVLLVLAAAVGRLEPVWMGVVLGATGWPAIARLVRGEAMRLSHSGHAEAARALGATPQRVITREILPGTFPAALVALTLGVADVLLLEAGLAFLGIGIRPPAPTWGGMLLEAQGYMADAPWLLFAPAGVLVAATAAATLVGDSLRRRMLVRDQ
ncbi:MAG TPA: ABC transporter permease [Gemmatimonadales bacterium]|nr:ABC transporter permease [Gemmatimonadales bacterium]